MGIAGDFYKRTKETFPESFHACGQRVFYNACGEAAPSVRIVDAPVRLHEMTYAGVRSMIPRRLAKLAALNADIDRLRREGVPLDSPNALWVDVFLLFMSRVNKFFEAHENAETYVLCFDRATPPAKILLHIERYKRASRLDDRYKIHDSAHLERIFSYHEVPEYFKYYMMQKRFVDKLGRHLAHKFIVDHYRPPPNKMFILDGPGRLNPYLFLNGERTMLDGDRYRNHCLEADMSILFYCTMFRNKNIEVCTTDGDLVLALLLHSRLRIKGCSQSAVAENSVDFHFSNMIIIEKRSTNHQEFADGEVTDAYYAQSQTTFVNETNPLSPSKQLYLERLDERRRRKQAENRELFGVDDDGFDLRSATMEAGEKRPQSSATQEDDVDDDDDDNDPNSDASSGSKRKRAPPPRAEPVGKNEVESNESLQRRCDVTYTTEGGKVFTEYEYVNVNHLFQSIHDYSLALYDPRVASTDLEAFLPVEQFCMMGMLCGNDYVRKPDGIGAKFLFNAYFKYLNQYGVMAYGRTTQGDQCTFVSPLKYEDPLHIVVDYEAVVRLVQSAFATKGSRAPFQVTDNLRVTCANVRFSMNYFANDFKTGIYAENCFDMCTQCTHSIYGYERPNPFDPPSRENIGRPSKICSCFLREIRAYAVRQSEGKVQWG